MIAGQPKILLISSTVVPGKTARSRRFSSILQSLPKNIQADALSLRFSDEGHIEKRGIARHMRVKVADADDPAFGRAVLRQLQAEKYDFIWVFDFVALEVLLENRPNILSLILDVDSMPTKAQWRSVNQVNAVTVASKTAQRLFGETVPTSVIPNIVDREVFDLPTIQMPSANRRIGVFMPPKRQNDAALTTEKFAFLRRLNQPQIQLIVWGVTPPPTLDASLADVKFLRLQSPQKRAKFLASIDAVVLYLSDVDRRFGPNDTLLEAIAVGCPPVVVSSSPVEDDVLNRDEHYFEFTPRANPKIWLDNFYTKTSARNALLSSVRKCRWINDRDEQRACVQTAFAGWMALPRHSSTVVLELNSTELQNFTDTSNISVGSQNQEAANSGVFVTTPMPDETVVAHNPFDEHTHRPGDLEAQETLVQPRPDFESNHDTPDRVSFAEDTVRPSSTLKTFDVTSKTDRWDDDRTLSSPTESEPSDPPQTK